MIFTSALDYIERVNSCHLVSVPSGHLCAGTGLQPFNPTCVSAEVALVMPVTF